MKLWCVFDLAAKKTQIEAMEAESLAEDFWSDNRKAQAHMQQMTALRDEVPTWESIDAQLSYLQGLAGLLEEAPDEALQAQIVASLTALQQQPEHRVFALIPTRPPSQPPPISSL